MTRPFPIQYLEVLATGEVLLEITCIDPIEVDDNEAFRAVVAWHDVARLGALGGNVIPPWTSSLSMSPPEQSGDRSVRFRFSKVNVDPRSLSGLENILHFLHIIRPLEKAVVAGQIVSSFLAVRGELPPLYEPVPFAYDYRATDKEVAVEIEFEGQQQEPILESLARDVVTWGTLGWACGYANRGALPVGGYLVVDDVDIYSDMLRVGIQRMDVSERAFDGLVNVLQNVHRSVGSLREVRVV